MKKKVFVIGLGLIGASLCRAIKGSAITLYGWDHSEETREIAEKTQLVDQVVTGIEAASQMDVIILAVPVQVSLEYLNCLATLPLKETVLVSDTGSTKATIMALAKQLPFDFIGGHPMAGSHKSGVKAGNPYLFEEAYYIVTDDCQSERTEELIALLRPTRAKFVRLTAKDHDEIVGVLSHLPHIVASGLVQISEKLNQKYPRASQLAVGGFRDITRIASSDPQMWTDILMTNQEMMIQLMEDWQGAMETLKQELIDQNQSAIQEFFVQAKQTRDQLPRKKQGAIPAFYDLYVDIPDIAGAVAKVTNVLSQANLSIINLSIQETREDIFGVLELSFKNQADLLKGQKLIEAEKFHCWIRS
ncbi:prephenate dehydrogenase [Enterococcus hirae]|nr:prephenate dehydrogenase [Enterococcus hirae]